MDASICAFEFPILSFMTLLISIVSAATVFYRALSLLNANSKEFSIWEIGCITTLR
jgi:hypothetical protein